MERSQHGMTHRQRMAGYGMVGILFLTMTACSSDQPKPLPPPTPEQVRGHADRAFEKLKQEEQEKTAQPLAPR